MGLQNETILFREVGVAVRRERGVAVARMNSKRGGYDRIEGERQRCACARRE